MDEAERVHNPLWTLVDTVNNNIHFSILLKKFPFSGNLWRRGLSSALSGKNYSMQLKREANSLPTAHFFALFSGRKRVYKSAQAVLKNEAFAAYVAQAAYCKICRL